ncbi:MAG: GAF domain-containing protein, partial [Chloroflexi bacterium]|nr:GAF domain-containing protein [Chloroflexota bacterium]
KAREAAEILRAATSALTESLNLEAILETLLDYLYRVVPYDTANIMLIEKESYLRVRAQRGYERWGASTALHDLHFEFNTSPHLSTIVSQQTSFLIPDTRQYADWVSVPGTEYIRNWLAVPLVANGKTIGLYSLDKADPNFFTDEHRHFAEALAAQAAIAIEKAALYTSELTARAQAETQAKQLAALNRVTQVVSSVLDLQAILEIAAREMFQLINARSCGLALLNPARTELNLVAFASRADEPSPVGLVIPLAGNLPSLSGQKHSLSADHTPPGAG